MRIPVFSGLMGDAGVVSDDDSNKRIDVRGTLIALWLVGPVILCVYAYAFGSWKVLPFAAMVGAASFVVGGMVGFLFGIPRTLTSETAGNPNTGLNIAVQYRPNSNLEQISDWLTKILVGIGLVQIGELGGALGTLSSSLGPGMQTADGQPGEAVARAFALAVVIYFLFAGFLSGYLQTRLKLLRLFRRADAEENEAEEAGAVRIAPPGGQ